MRAFPEADWGQVKPVFMTGCPSLFSEAYCLVSCFVVFCLACEKFCHANEDASLHHAKN